MKTHFIFIYMRWCSFMFHTTQKDECYSEKSICFTLSSPLPFHHHPLLLVVAILVISGINCWKCYPGPIWRYLVFYLSLSLSLSLSLFSFFSVDVHLYRKIMTCFLGLWVCGGVGTFTSNGGFFQIFS